MILFNISASQSEHCGIFHTLLVVFGHTFQQRLGISRKRCYYSRICASSKMAGGMHGAALDTIGPTWSFAPNSDITGKLEESETVEIVALSDDKSHEAEMMLLERGKRSNPMRQSMRMMQCNECMDDKQGEQRAAMARGDAQKLQSPFTKLLFQRVPIITWLPRLNMQIVKADIIAGLTVGVMVIPQSMSYANIAGLQYIYGMYSACVPTFIYGFFGQSRQLAVGPVAMVSLLVEAGLRGKLDAGNCGPAEEQYKVCPSDYAALTFVTAAVVGLLQIVGSILKLGFLVHFLGHPVTSGFTSGAAIIIGLSQVKYMFGYNVPKSQFIYDTIGNLLQNINQTNGYSLVLGVCWLLFLICNKKMAQKYKRLSFMAPLGPLVSCAVGTLLIWLVKPLREEMKVKYVGNVPSGLMPFSVTKWDFEVIPRVLPTAVSACLIGYMESIAIGKNLAAKHGYEIEAGQEMFALGVSNFIGAMFSCYPVTGSFSRSAVNNSTGARSQLSGLITSAIMLCTLLFLTPLFYYLPKFALAAIVINSVIPLVALSEARRLYHVKRHDFVLWVVAFLGTLFLGVLMGIVVAVSLSLVIVIYESVRPQITILWRIPGTTIYRNMKQESSGSFIPNVFICRIGSSMYFANASFIKDMLLAYVSDLEEVNPTEYIVLEMTPVVTLDSTAIHVIHDIVSDFRSRGIQTAFAMVGNRVDKTMRKAKLKQFIGEQWYFPTVNEAVHYCLRHQHAKRKCKAPQKELATTPCLSEQDVEVGALSVQPGTELGFSNDLHHACTVVFISLAKDMPMSITEITALFCKNQLSIVRAQVEPLSDEGAKHTYYVKSIKTGKKLSEFELDRVRQDLEALIQNCKTGRTDKTSEFLVVDGCQETRIKLLEDTIATAQHNNEKIQEQLQSQSERFEKFLNMHEEMVRATSHMSNSAK